MVAGSLAIPLIRRSAALGAVLLGLAGAPALAAAPELRSAATVPSITVTASASIPVVPDMVRIVLGINTQSATAGGAFEANTRAVTTLIAEAEALGIARRDVATVSLTLRPVYATKRTAEGEVNEIIGHAVTNALSLSLAPVERAGVVLDRLVARGADTIDAVVLDVRDADRRRDQARAEAVRIGRQRAELLASSAGVRLGRLLDLREADPSQGGAPKLLRAAAGMPIEAGEALISADVTLTFEILEGGAN